MPEYGRHVQQMVDQCVLIEDRDERNACARAIVDTICRLFPQQRTSPEWRAKLWEHLAIMSGFKLDIDYPGEIPTPEALAQRPAPLPLPQTHISRRVYGNNVLQMIDVAVDMDPENPDRHEFVILIANHMKKLMTAENPEGATDRRILADLAQLSGGRLLLNPDEVRLREFEIVEAPGQSRKKKRKR